VQFNVLALFNVCCPEPELCLLMCCSGPSFYPFEDWPLNTVFYADEQKLDSNKRPNLLFGFLSQAYAQARAVAAKTFLSTETV